MRRVMALSAALLATSVGSASAQSAAPAAQPRIGEFRSTGIPQRDTLARLMKPLTAEFTEVRLEDVFSFIASATGAELDVLWIDDQNPVGLDKEFIVRGIKSRGLSGLQIIERVLSKVDAAGDITGGSQWQMADSGEIQIGPKERLNDFRRLEIYPITDLLTEIPEFSEAPDFDLNSAAQGGGGGGGTGQSPFQSSENTSFSGRTLDERADDLVALIVRLVEPEQWEQNGGSGATIEFFQGSLLVNGPDYVHRQLAGYPYWPERVAAANPGAVVERRYVQFNGAVQFSEPEGFDQRGVTAVVPGDGGG